MENDLCIVITNRLTSVLKPVDFTRMNTFNVEKFAKWGFISSIVFIVLVGVTKARELATAAELIALVFGLLLGGILIADLCGWYKRQSAEEKLNSKTKKK
jgi:uncharacterized membrane protein YdcZ (DUF606 family)